MSQNSKTTKGLLELLFSSLPLRNKQRKKLLKKLKRHCKELLENEKKEKEPKNE